MLSSKGKGNIMNKPDSDTIVKEPRTPKVKPKAKPKTKPKAKSKKKVAKPNMYQVSILNDDYTTMDFVVHVIQKFFYKTEDEAAAIMINIHKDGKGICGIFTLEIAETKVLEVIDEARKHQFPLMAVAEKV